MIKILYYIFKVLRLVFDWSTTKVETMFKEFYSVSINFKKNSNKHIKFSFFNW